jgi:hypothetical protein
MPPKAHGQSPIAPVGKKVEEVFIPAPGTMPGPMDEEQWCRMRFARRSLVDHLEHEPVLPRVWNALENIAARSPIRRFSTDDVLGEGNSTQLAHWPAASSLTIAANRP